MKPSYLGSLGSTGNQTTTMTTQYERNLFASFVVALVFWGCTADTTRTPSVPDGGSDAADTADGAVELDGTTSVRDADGGDLDRVDAAETTDAETTDAETDGADPRPTLQFCRDAPVPSDRPTEDWNNITSSAVAELEPDHSARDAITNPESRVSLEGKFAYGSVSKDLEGEDVEIWLDDCSGSYRKLGERTTDGDGRVLMRLPPDKLPPIGVYDLYFRVLGDGSSASATLRILPKGTELVIFDIDGTLTQGNRELAQGIGDDLFDPLKSGDYVPKARAGAVRATVQRRREMAYQLVYLTARPYWLKERTREWLDTKGMAPGLLRMTRSTSQGLPTQDAVGRFKANFLSRLDSQGFDLVAAYGNSDTDIWAYDRAEVPKERTFVPGEHGGSEETVDIGEDFLDHVNWLREEGRPADQPFRYP